jgi:hypothetical protein
MVITDNAGQWPDFHPQMRLSDSKALALKAETLGGDSDVYDDDIRTFLLLSGSPFDLGWSALM